MLKSYLELLIANKNLSAAQCHQALQHILADADPHQVAAFLVLLHAKGETVEELTAITQTMREKMLSLDTKDKLLDIVGTGGDGAQTLNISTAASILAASCGVKIAKHGNRSVSSQCGSADVLEALGIDIESSVKRILDSIKEINIGFCYAPNFHPAMKKIKAIRSALGIPTTFNLLGPLLNPARAEYYLLGVFNENYQQLLADVLMQLNVSHAFIVHGHGLDELSTLGPSNVIVIKNASKTSFTLDPKDYGFNYCILKDIQGGNPQNNAQLLREVFQGKKGPIADTLMLNAGVGVFIAERAATIQEGIELARRNLQNGAALSTLQQWINF